VALNPSCKSLYQKKDWQLYPSAFQKLLVWLDEGDNSDGQSYLRMRSRLIVYFERKNCASPDELADETLNRVARRLEEEEVIETESPAKYCYIVARFVFMEYLRDQQTERSFHDEAVRGSLKAAQSVYTSDDKRSDIKERILSCLDRCSDKLLSRDRDIILRYYIGSERAKIENRRALAQELGITVNALVIRACRIRDKLEACVRECADRK
jgi:DNA-directed RNA polymerase specialized sigma24 family protein